jgi:hypothetical protein
MSPPTFFDPKIGPEGVTNSPSRRSSSDRYSPATLEEPLIRNPSDLTRQQIVAQELGQLRALGLVRRQASLKRSEGMFQRAKAATEAEPAATEPSPAAAPPSPLPQS